MEAGYLHESARGIPQDRNRLVGTVDSPVGQCFLTYCEAEAVLLFFLYLRDYSGDTLESFQFVSKRAGLSSILFVPCVHDNVLLYEQQFLSHVC